MLKTYASLAHVTINCIFPWPNCLTFLHIQYKFSLLPNDIYCLATVHRHEQWFKILHIIMSLLLTIQHRNGAADFYTIYLHYAFVLKLKILDLPEQQFWWWDNVILRYIWQKDQELESTVAKKKKKGSYSPCLKDYYIAAQLRPWTGWCKPGYFAIWKEIERL